MIFFCIILKALRHEQTPKAQSINDLRVIPIYHWQRLSYFVAKTILWREWLSHHQKLSQRLRHSTMDWPFSLVLWKEEKTVSLYLCSIPGMQVVRDISLAHRIGKTGNLFGESNITKLQDFQNDEVLHSYWTNPDIILYLKSFCGDNIKSVHTMFINKPPGMGSSSRHPFHQDLAYFPFGPANQIVAAWAAL
jgi:hypothetical protein